MKFCFLLLGIYFRFVFVSRGNGKLQAAATTTTIATTTERKWLGWWDYFARYLLSATVLLRHHGTNPESLNTSVAIPLFGTVGKHVPFELTTYLM
ncbi:hypothetical protein FN846DRAFT_231557 [Sphaerosporella brunnea]|uniref:Secreted protein n=1 Tax=Sphaerosporella brunnea TaxID=1250544 RepID=A0A5J5EPQ3_9PEZI|nr:hypothetical protein FN846DRAFT_231557 [Sphaerosporella brunnea]